MVERLVLGLNTDHGDSSAFLLGNQGAIAAIAEERINRKKHCADFPANAIQEVLRIGGVEVSDLTDIAVARNPWANALHKAAFIARFPASGLAMAWSRFGLHRRVVSTRERIADALGVSRESIRAELHRVEHHLAHVASAFYWSPFEHCSAFSLDGAGDFASTMFARCAGNRIQLLGRSHWPHSLGVFYTALTQFIGFDKYGEEYKVMGLAAYGQNRYSALMRKMVRFDPALGLQLNLKYFGHQKRSRSFEDVHDGVVRIPRLWGAELARELGPARRQEEDIGQREQDLAASMQARYEEVFLEMVASLVRKTGLRDIVMAGGCALNSVANGRMLAEGYVDQAYFHPAASDDGTAAGAALHVLHGVYGLPRTGKVGHAFWGTEWSDAEIEKALQAKGRPFRKLKRDELVSTAAQAIQQGKIVGWFQGREEWGPRALGNRSILCNPAFPDMKATLNARIKNREPFRPFAPAICEEDLELCFEGSHEVPFMIVVYKVKPEWQSKLPAITHKDGTGRVQTVSQEQNPLFHQLISKFKQISDVPSVLNTSFNENEPIVHTPGQAIDCFERTKMDRLGIGPFWLEK